MEKPQASFIPKKDNTGGFAYKTSGGLFSFFSSLIFIVTLVSSLGVFAYDKYLSGRIARMENNLTLARQSLRPDLIKELSRSDARLVSAKELIDKHITLSSFFEFLQINTLKSVRFNGMSFSKGEGDTFTVTMKGEARTYATVALQASIFSSDSNLINPQFSDLDLNENGMVVFSFKTGINPKLISYREQFRAIPTIPSTPDTQSLPTDSTPVPPPATTSAQTNPATGQSEQGAVNQTN